MKTLSSLFTVLLLSAALSFAQIYPGADEKSPSRAQFFTWINNTNEGATAAQTLTNLEFFGWLQREYGMQLDIYAFDAGAIDGKRYYGSIYSDRFKAQFPEGFDPIYQKAKDYGIRLGVWGGPDGFGTTPEEKQARIDQMVKLCRDYDFALFKFDAVCGPLLPENEDAFITMMTECRKHSPDLILLNHRLGLEKAEAYATTFLWEGSETYIDVFMSNSMTAPHHRGQALARGLPPGMQRLTEDHGTCISSCPDYWDDDLVLQAFNRSLILAPELYGNPWLLRDSEYPKLARIYNLHRKWRDIMVDGMVLPSENFGPFAVSRGNSATRIVTLRNLSWEALTYEFPVDEQLGLKPSGNYTVMQFHPTEKILGRFRAGESLSVKVDPFRSCLLVISSENIDEPAIAGTDYEVVRNVPGKPVEIDLLGWPGTTARVSLRDAARYGSLNVGGELSGDLARGKSVEITFPGNILKENITRRVGTFTRMDDPAGFNWQSLYEATVFAADNNALEVRSIQRSGWSSMPEVRAAQEAFFNQKTFVDRGIWDKNLFDGNMNTGFWASKKYNADQTVKGGCLRLDLGSVTEVDSLVVKTGDVFALQPLLEDEGNWVEISTDLLTWERLTFLAGTVMNIEIGKPVRYLRFIHAPSRILEIDGYRNGRAIDRSSWTASNLFAPPSRLKCHQVWKSVFRLNEIATDSYLCVALNGVHGVEGAYVAATIDGRLVGAPDRAQSYPSNTWEYVNSRSARNYTYYIPLSGNEVGREIEVFILGFEEKFEDFSPEVWIHAYPVPYERVRVSLERR